jgi:hypothetical protein
VKLTIASLFAVAFAASASVALADDGAKSPEDAVKKLEAATKAGDTKAVAQVYGGAVGAAYHETCDASAKLAAAQRKLGAALDSKFGKKEEKLAGAPFDVETAKQNMRRTVSMTIARKDGEGDRLALFVTVVERARGGSGTTTHEEELVAAKNGGWHVFPKRMENAEAGQDFAAKIKRLATAYDRVAADVKEGKHATREAARDAAEKAWEDVYGVKKIEIAERPTESKPDPAEAQAIELAFTVIVAKAIGPGDDELRAALEELALPDPDAWFKSSFDRDAETFNGWYAKLRPKFVGDFAARMKDAVNKKKQTDVRAVPGTIGERLGCKTRVYAVKLVEPGKKDGTELYYFAHVGDKVRFVGDFAPQR